ncbi:polysaccharide pyruvyl transferase family protein [Emticicia sp. CRIBPO]|uniref:polysaccharide pyruvyl transferase family protein n=1 Tax=Emticicia sp. CRIBPO TaxID=2683258 RepID=UPI0014135B7C|nr:polysaccharide pyruvyl transferase family protein [Emticicia sp. CRIBPO]NBA85283.1 polysaccharide pyruvyl transferase family protein [Emticicia sp. CRIBPO]
MKIGILTLPLHTNYGGNIQAYALMTVLKRAGHEVCLIDRQLNRPPKWKMPVFFLKRFVLKYLFGKKETEIFLEARRNREDKVIREKTQPFIEKYISPQTTPFYSSSSLKNKIGSYNFDAIIVGSDQVWRPAYTPNISDYFLSFWNADNVRRISYAASFGTDNWEFSELETETCQQYLKKFNAVSVREDIGVDMCKKYFSITPSHVLDPTMLLGPEDYITVIDPDKTHIKKGILVYVLDQSLDKTKAIDFLSNTLKLDVFHTNSKVESLNVELKDRIAPPMDGWLAGFRDADFVITDSFHACVFSILFNKPFFVYGNEGRGMVRFHSLLKMFGLENRLISSSNPLDYERVMENINWKNVEVILKEKRMLSNKFLNDSLT